MSKYFQGLPAEFEQYNPEAVTDYKLPYSDTFDEQGLLHSYNDKPATVNYSSTSQLVLTWYHHGVISRAENKPCRIACTKDYYSTLNENNEVHSFADLPSGIRVSNSNANYSLDWRKDGKLHRDGDLPSNIIWAQGHISFLRYAKNGKGHRDDGLPAAVSDYNETWLIRGQLHNKYGVAIEEYDKQNSVATSQYSLYGVKMQEESFTRIQAYHISEQVPFWVAFLHELGLLTDETAISLKGDTSIFSYSVPTSWKLRSLGITNEKYKKAVNEKSKSQNFQGFHRMEFPELTQLDAAIEVIEYEQELEEF